MIKEGTRAIKWTRFRAGRSQPTRSFFSFVRFPAATFKFIKIGARIVCHGRYVAFELAEVAVPKMLFASGSELNSEFPPPRDPAPA